MVSDSYIVSLQGLIALQACNRVYLVLVSLGQPLFRIVVGQTPCASSGMPGITSVCLSIDEEIARVAQLFQFCRPCQQSRSDQVTVKDLFHIAPEERGTT